MTILCATSFSRRSEQAIRAGAAIAARLKLPLTLAHAVDAPARRLLGEAPERASREALERAAAPLRARGLEVTALTLAGDPADRIPEAAGERSAALVLLGGTAGGEGHAGVLASILRRLEIPALAIHDAGPFERWCQGEGPLRVMLGVDRSASAAAARSWLGRLAEIGPLEVVAGHVYWPPLEYRRFGLPQPLVFTEPDEALSRTLATEVADRAGVMPDGRPPRVALRVGLGRVADHLLVLAQQEKADLLVVGTHHRRGLGRFWSVSEVAAIKASLSVACVPTAALPHGPEAELPELMDVVAATDFTPAGDRAVGYACRLVAPAGTVHLVHVVPGPVSAERESLLRADLEGRVPRQAGRAGAHFRAHVVDGEPALAIAQLAERLHADAICVGSHGRPAALRAVLGSVARSLLAQARRPVLVVPPLP